MLMGATIIAAVNPSSLMITPLDTRYQSCVSEHDCWNSSETHAGTAGVMLDFDEEEAGWGSLSPLSKIVFSVEIILLFDILIPPESK